MKRNIKKYGMMLAILLIVVSCGKIKDQNDFIKETSEKVENTESIYMITDQFTNQDNQVVKLEQFKGKPTIISMMFTSCGYACPRLTSGIQRIEKELGANVDKVNFVLVSFDVERDTPSVLKDYAKTHGFKKNWTLLHGDDSGVQTLSILLNIPFEKDDEGDFSHGNMVTVLDENGVIQHQVEGLGNEPEQTVVAVNKLFKK